MPFHRMMMMTGAIRRGNTATTTSATRSSRGRLSFCHTTAVMTSSLVETMRHFSKPSSNKIEEDGVAQRILESEVCFHDDDGRGGGGYRSQTSKAPPRRREDLSPQQERGSMKGEEREVGDAGGGDDDDDDANAIDTVETLDIFARAKVLNFIKRLDTSAATTTTTPSSDASAATKMMFEIRQVHTFDGSMEYFARIRLPLPDGYGVRYGMGSAPTAKDAEVVAAMHAERVIDALGFPMFQLSSKQQRHAEAARSAKRWAPMPGEDPKPFSTQSPPPLQFTPSTKRTVDEQLHDDERVYAPVTKQAGSFSPMRCTLASPSFFDPTSMKRVEQYFQALGLPMVRCLRALPLHHLQRKEDMRRTMQRTTDLSTIMRKGGGTTNSRDGGDPSTTTASIDASWLVQIRLPLSPAFGSRVASGRAPDRKSATILACMHAELLLDAVGVALFPHQPALQAQHAEECVFAGRWATSRTDGSEARCSAVTPAPLKLVKNMRHAEVVSSNGTGGGGRGDTSPHAETHSNNNNNNNTINLASDTMDTTIQLHARAIERLAHVTRVTFVDKGAKKDMFAYLRRVSSVQDEDGVGDDDNDNGEDADDADLSNSGGWDGGPPRHRRHRRGRNVADDEIVGNGSDLSRVPKSSAKAMSPFLTQPLGVAGRETYRTTLMISLPLPVDILAAAASGSTVVQRRMHHVIAIGIGPSSEISEQCCAMHGILMLGSLGIPLYALDEQQSVAAQRITSLGGMAMKSASTCSAKRSVTTDWESSFERCAIKCVDYSAVGRVVVSGLSDGGGDGADGTSGGGTMAADDDLSKAEAELSHFQQMSSIADWSLAPDDERSSNNDGNNGGGGSGDIILHPSVADKHAMKFVHTLGSVRIPDQSAISRIQDYLERHGIDVANAWQIEVPPAASASATMTTSAAARSADGAAESLVRARLILPMPIAYGKRTAEGLATTTDVAKTLCAMHAELILDFLGVPLYDHAELQMRHAITARSLGRWAIGAMTSDVVRARKMVPSPPRLVQPSLSSSLWLRVARHWYGSDVDVNRVPLDEVTKTLHRFMSHTPLLTDVQEGNIVTVHRKHLSDYFRRRRLQRSNAELNRSSSTSKDEHKEKNKSGVTTMSLSIRDIDDSIRVFQFHGPLGHVLYGAELDVPVPERFGRRVARACASTRRNAYFLCLTHAVHIIDALRLPLFTTNEKQRQHSEYERSRGLTSPASLEECTWRDLPADTPNTPGLRCLDVGVTLVGAAVKASSSSSASQGNTSVADDDDGSSSRASISLTPPPRPDNGRLSQLLLDAAGGSQSSVCEIAWRTYVKQCHAFIEAKRLHSHYHALVMEHRAPRTGVEFVDAGLDAIEKEPKPNSHAKSQAKSLCRNFGLDPPDHFEVESVGQHPNKMYLASHEVVGTPFVAYGFGSESFSAIARAAMHYAWIVQRLGPFVAAAADAAGSSVLSPNVWEEVKQNILFSQQQQQRHQRQGGVSSHGGAAAASSSAQRQRSHHEVVELIVLYSAVTPPGEAASYYFRERTLANGSQVFVCFAELAESSGLRVTAKGESTVSPTESKEKAFLELHKVLETRAPYQALMHRVSGCAQLSSHRLSILAPPSMAIRDRIRVCRDAWKTSPQQRQQGERNVDAMVTSRCCSHLLLAQVPLLNFGASRKAVASSSSSSSSSSSEGEEASRQRLRNLWRRICGMEYPLAKNTSTTTSTSSSGTATTVTDGLTNSTVLGMETLFVSTVAFNALIDAAASSSSSSEVVRDVQSTLKALQSDEHFCELWLRLSCFFAVSAKFGVLNTALWLWALVVGTPNVQQFESRDVMLSLKERRMMGDDDAATRSIKDMLEGAFRRACPEIFDTTTGDGLGSAAAGDCDRVVELALVFAFGCNRHVVSSSRQHLIENVVSSSSSVLEQHPFFEDVAKNTTTTTNNGPMWWCTLSSHRGYRAPFQLQKGKGTLIFAVSPEAQLSLWDDVLNLYLLYGGALGLAMDPRSSSSSSSTAADLGRILSDTVDAFRVLQAKLFHVPWIFPTGSGAQQTSAVAAAAAAAPPLHDVVSSAHQKPAAMVSSSTTTTVVESLRIALALLELSAMRVSSSEGKRVSPTGREQNVIGEIGGRGGGDGDGSKIVVP